jgi:polyisoprenoid-binding protein YceI
MDTPRAVLAVDPGNASVRFSVRWFGLITVRGSFSVVHGTLEAPNNGAPPRISIAVDSQSIRTGIGLRDRHLRGMRFLDSAKHPEIRFESDRVSRHNGVWDVKGRLMLRGMERTVAISVLDEEASPTQRRLTARFSVPRLPHAIGSAGGIRKLNPLLWAIGREVALQVELMVPAAMLAPEHVPAR